jgi:DNA polymerase-3 subunit epsilon
MNKLVGSEKQVKWAEAVRNELVMQYGKNISGISIVSADWWIKARNVQSLDELEELASNHQDYGPFLSKYPPYTRDTTLPFLTNIPPNLIIVDTETSGINKAGEVIEIAAIEYRTGKVIIEGLIQPKNIDTYKDDSKAGKIHGITREELLKEPTLLDIWGDIVDVLYSDRYVPSSFNASFDAQMIHHSAMLWGLPVPQSSWVCLMKLATAFIGSSFWVSLGEAAEYFGIEQVESHRAMADVLTTRKVLMAMEELVKPKPVYRRAIQRSRLAS